MFGETTFGIQMLGVNIRYSNNWSDDIRNSTVWRDVIRKFISLE